MRGSDNMVGSVLDKLHLRCLWDLWAGLFRWQIEHFDLELRRQVRAGGLLGAGGHEQEGCSQMVNETPRDPMHLEERRVGSKPEASG